MINYTVTVKSRGISMKTKKIKTLTTAQFAKLHEVNKRTLHYYDEIKLFSPKTKSEAGYRYYDLSQSLDFEYIRMLKELSMSIEEIIAYRKQPNTKSFLQLADCKIEELEHTIESLKRTKKVLQAKREQAIFCQNLRDQEIRIEHCSQEDILCLPYDFAQEDISQLFVYIKEHWSMEQIRMGIGSYISLDKLYANDFSIYDGIFSPAFSKQSHSTYKPSGHYLCGYIKGSWDRLPSMYIKLLEYAKKQHLQLSGYAYEIGLNEFLIAQPDDYITKIAIRIKE